MASEERGNTHHYPSSFSLTGLFTHNKLQWSAQSKWIRNDLASEGISKLDRKCGQKFLRMTGKKLFVFLADRNSLLFPQQENERGSNKKALLLQP